MADEFVWLMHPDVGIPWRCPAGAVGFWTGRGHEPCDPPVEPDVTRAEQPAPADEPTSGASAKPKSKRAAQAALTEEGAE